MRANIRESLQTVVLAIIFIAAATIATAATPNFGTPTGTPSFMTLFGWVTVGGDPVPAGVEIAAFDSEGNLCGSAEVKSDDSTFILHIYGDDLTSAVDEGAKSGEGLTFEVYLPGRGFLGGDALSFSRIGKKDPPALPPDFTELGSYGMSVNVR